MPFRAKTIAYWTTTGLLAAAIASGGLAEVLQRPETVQGMAQLGYPAYFVVVLGVWKILATLAVLAPGLPRLKEWAYAGIFFNMTGAAVSHAVSGDAAWHLGVTLGFAALAVGSWALRPASRVTA
ncbi:MAG: DoxX family protein [Gemmatimonadales bacterium]